MRSPCDIKPIKSNEIFPTLLEAISGEKKRLYVKISGFSRGNMQSKKKRSVGTHDGPFHADEVTACALLLVYNLVDKEKIVRTRNPSLLAQCEYVCDVGGVFDPEKRLFDHHQVEYLGELSSAGMVLDHLLNQEIIDQEEHRFLKDHLIGGIDAHDNGRLEPIPGVCTFSHVIANFAPLLYDSCEEEHHQAFHVALTFTCGYLERLRSRHHYALQCRASVAQAMQVSKECLVFDQKIPWLENFFALGGERHPALFVMMPAGEHWKLRGIPPSYEARMSVRLPLPKPWAGLMDGELEKVSGIRGAIFCHKGRFISVWQTKESAMQALEQTLKQANLHDHHL